jgi:predicted secreted Zn-dependent protease
MHSGVADLPLEATCPAASGRTERASADTSYFSVLPPSRWNTNCIAHAWLSEEPHMLPLSSPPKIEVPGPIVRQDTRYYLIEGRNEPDLVREMNTKGYLNQSMTRYWGYTSPEVNWSYDVKRYGGQKCALVSPKVVVLITTTLPQWFPPPDASATVIAKWRKLDQAMHHHESEHAQIAAP